jgi:hypothetical protein
MPSRNGELGYLTRAGNSADKVVLLDREPKSVARPALDVEWLSVVGHGEFIQGLGGGIESSNFVTHQLREPDQPVFAGDDPVRYIVAVGVSNSVITPWDKFPILPVPCSANQMPVLLKVSSNGLAPDVGIRNSRNVLVAVVNSPI